MRITLEDQDIEALVSLLVRISGEGEDTVRSRLGMSPGDTFPADLGLEHGQYTLHEGLDAARDSREVLRIGWSIDYSQLIQEETEA